MSDNKLALVQPQITLIQDLISSLPPASLNSDDPKVQAIIMQAESELTIHGALQLRSHVPNFRKIKLEKEDDSLKNYLKVISRLINRFLKLHNINWSMDQLSVASYDLVERSDTWNIADVVCLLKYIRQNPKGLKDLRIYPNFSPADFMRMASLYNEEQAIEEEKMKIQEKAEKNKLISIVEAQKKNPETGEIKTVNIGFGDFVTKVADNLERGIKPKNAIERAIHKHDVQREVQNEKKPYWEKEKDNALFRTKIEQGANRLGKDDLPSLEESIEGNDK